MTTSISPTIDEPAPGPRVDPAPAPKVSLNIDSPVAEPVEVPTPPVFSTPSFGSLLAADEATSDALPAIVEATPSSPVDSDLAALGVDAPSPVPASPVPPSPLPSSPPVVEPAPTAEPASGVVSKTALVEAPATVAEPASEPAPAAAVPSPQPDQSAAFSLPQQRHAVPSVSYAPVAASKARRGPKKDRSTAIARMGFFLLLVAAVVSAGVIFGRPYLFSEAWEENVLPFADSVEAARGTDFVEAITLVPQPTTTHRDLVTAQLLGTPSADIPMWRALGLAGADATDDAALGDLISQQGHVLYSTADGQVYYDQAFTEAHRDALIARSMAAAALDQDFGYSTEAGARSTDGAALTAAHVLQQSTLIQEQSSYDQAVPGPEVAPLAFLPPVLDYRLSAPIVFAELLPPVNDLVANPLAEIGADGPGPISTEPLSDIAVNSDVGTEQVARDAVVTDRSFWYMVFAAHLDAPRAYDMSNQLQQARLQMVTGVDGTCAVATLSGGDGAVNQQLRLNLDAWVAAAAPELGASVTTLPDLSTQLRSCDPVSGYVSNAKFGVGRQLIAWRAAELAVTNAMTAQGADQGQIDQALGRLSSTPSVIALTELPAGTSPINLAEAARLAAGDAIGTSTEAIIIAPADSAEG